MSGESPFRHSNVLTDSLVVAAPDAKESLGANRYRSGIRRPDKKERSDRSIQLGPAANDPSMRITCGAFGGRKNWLAQFEQTGVHPLCRIFGTGAAVS